MGTLTTPSSLEQLQPAQFQLLLAPHALALPHHRLPQALHWAGQGCSSSQEDLGCQLHLCTSGGARLGAATESSRSTVDSIQCLLLALLKDL